MSGFPTHWKRQKSKRFTQLLVLKLKVKFQSRQKGMDLNIEIGINRIEENPEINPHTYGLLIFDMNKHHSLEKYSHFKKFCWNY